MPRNGWSTRASVIALASMLILLALPTAANAEEVSWQRTFGATAADRIGGYAADETGVTVVGTTAGSLGGPSAGGTDAFVRRYAPSGALTWRRQFGTSGDDTAIDVAADGSGLIVLGGAAGPLDGTGATGASGYLRRYGLDGNVVWTRQRSSIVGDTLAADDAGFTILSRHGIASFIERYDRDGNALWKVQPDEAIDDYEGIAADDAGIAVVQGDSTEDSFYPEGGWLRRFDRAGALLWSKRLVSRSDDYAVAADATGMTVAGYRTGDLGDTDSYTFAARYDRAGGLVWTRRFPEGDFVFPSVAADDTGPVVMIGHVTHRFQADGRRLWTHTSTERTISAASSGIFTAGGRGLQMRLRRWGEASPGGRIALPDLPHDYRGVPHTMRSKISLDVQATDPDGVAKVRLSNSPRRTANGLLTLGRTLRYAPTIDWDLADRSTGGSGTDGRKVIYAQWRDGAGHWSVIKHVLVILDTVRPVVAAPVVNIEEAFVRAGPEVEVAVRWKSRDQGANDGYLGVPVHQVDLRTDKGAWTTICAEHDACYSGIHLSIGMGHTYQVRVRGRDWAGNASTVAYGIPFRIHVFQEGDAAIHYSSGWRRTTLPGAYGGRVASSSQAGATASLTFTGQGAALVGTLSTDRGNIDVSIGGGAGREQSLYWSSFRPGVFVANLAPRTPGRHTVTLTVTGTHDPRSTGDRVDLDAIFVLETVTP